MIPESDHNRLNSQIDLKLKETSKAIKCNFNERISSEKGRSKYYISNKPFLIFYSPVRPRIKRTFFIRGT